MVDKKQLKKITPWLWEIPQRAAMRVPARIYASEQMLDDICQDRSLEQLMNVATLPGIQKYAVLMPDAHEGYGFPIGGVAAFRHDGGIISPGGIGYDINCGVRLLRSRLTADLVAQKLSELGRKLHAAVPSGVGRGGRLRLSDKELDAVLLQGAPRMIAMGYGDAHDLDNLESRGCLEVAEPKLVSERAKDRGRDQIGTLGAGNHFVEVDVVETIYDTDRATQLGLSANQVTVLIHTGSRGLGHQIATDYIRIMMQNLHRYDLQNLPDRELACAPFQSPEGQQYFRAMAAGANFAWANRQMITWEIREAWQKILGAKAGSLSIVYDVAHNIAKIEDDMVIHRKGATRAFPNQPVLVPGSMGTASYVLIGQQKALEESFGSSCHGAGRRMSRAHAKRTIRGSELRARLARLGIVVNADSDAGLAEEAPEAYKDVDQVVEVIHRSGIATKVARLKPIAVVKG